MPCVMCAGEGRGPFDKLSMIQRNRAEKISEGKRVRAALPGGK